MDNNEDLVTDQTEINLCNKHAVKATKLKKKNKNTLVVLNDSVADSEDNNPDKLLEENNKLREQNLKLQKILAIAGVKFDNENYAQEAKSTSAALQSSSITYTPASSTFISDIQDVKVSGGSCFYNQNNGNNRNNDDDYNSSSNNNVECSTDAIVKSKNSKKGDDEHIAGSSSEILLCDTSTNIECSSMQEDIHNHNENDMFSELQVDTTVDLGSKSCTSDDLCLTLSLPTQSSINEIKSSNYFNGKTSSSYLNSDNIVDISPPLPLNDQNNLSSSTFSSNSSTSSFLNNSMHVLNNSLNNGFNVFGQQSGFPPLGNQAAAMLNLQRFEAMGGPLNLMSNFNNGIFINQLGQPISFLPPPNPPLPPSLILNTNTGLLTPQGKILSPANGSLVGPQGNVLLQNCAGLGQTFAPTVTSLNYIPQATPLFNGSQMKTAPIPSQMTLNVLPQASQNRDFLMLPNGKLVPISTQPSLLPTTPNTAMQSILTGFSNNVRLQGSQVIGGPNIHRNPQPFGFLPNQFSILGSSLHPNDISRLSNPTQFSVNGLPVLTPGQIPHTLQVLNQLPQFSPQTNLSSALNPQPAIIQPQNLLMQNNPPCMMAYLTPEGTIVLSLQQPGSKKMNDEIQKSNQLLNSNLSQEKKTQRRIMPKPPTNDSLINSGLNSIVPKGNSLNCNIIASTTSSSNVMITTADEGDKISQPYITSNQSIHNSNDSSKKSSLASDQNHSEIMGNMDEFNMKRKNVVKKRDSNTIDKKKRVKITSKVEQFGIDVNPPNSSATSNLLNSENHSPVLQDISCCMLNDSIHEQFVHNLNDDDQGDINQFSDLIVMDNDITSNPMSKDDVTKSGMFDLKNNFQMETSKNNFTAKNQSLLTISSTIPHQSESIVVSSSSNIETFDSLKNEKQCLNQYFYNGINNISTNKSYTCFYNNDKKLKKKKKKHLNQGLLTIEPLVSMSNVLLNQVPNSLNNSATSGSDSFVNNNDKNDCYDKNLKNTTIKKNSDDAVSNDNEMNKAISFDDIISKEEISSHIYDSKLNEQLKDQNDLNCNISSYTDVKHDLTNKNVDSVLLNTSTNASEKSREKSRECFQPEKVEEGTQTMRHERRKKKKKMKKEKFEYDNDMPPTLTREPSAIDNIPDKLSFSEDQLMDVVEKVENLVAQSGSVSFISLSSPFSSSSSSKNTLISNFNDNCSFYFNKSIDEINKSPVDIIPPKLEPLVNTSSGVLKTFQESQNKRKHEEIDPILKTKKLKTQNDNEITGNKLLKSSAQCVNVEKNCSSSNNLKTQNEAIKDQILATGLPNTTSESQSISSQELSKISNDKGSLKISKPEEISARHVGIASLARTTNAKISLTKVSSNKPRGKASDIHSNSESSSKSQSNQNKVPPDLDLLANDAKPFPDESHHSNKSFVLHDVDNLNPVVIKNEPKSVSSNLSDCNVITNANSCEINNDICSNTLNNIVNQNNKKEDEIDNNNFDTSISTANIGFKNNLNMCSNSSNTLSSSNDLNTKKKDSTTTQSFNETSLAKTKLISSTSNEMNVVVNQSQACEKFSCNKETNMSCNATDKKINLNLENLKSESHMNVDQNLETKMTDSSLSEQFIINKETSSNSNNINNNINNNNSSNNNNNQQKSKSKSDSQGTKVAKFQSGTDNNTNINITSSMNNNTSHFYSMDDPNKKFSYPNIFAPSLFSDPYSSSCAQFSTFPVNGGPTFDTGFMLPPCLPFDSPVANAGFNYYGGDSSRYSHFGHSSLTPKNPCHSFSSIPSDYPSCSMEPKKVSSNSNFGNNSNRVSKEDNFKNKIELFKKDSFIPSDFQFDAQFMFPNTAVSEKSNMTYCMDNSNYSLPFSSSAFLNNNNAKGYSNNKFDNQIPSKGNKSFPSPSSSSSLLTYNRTSSSTLASPPLHHHPLLFDQKNSSFSSGFDLPFNPSNLNTFIENCGIMDQSFMPPMNSAFSHNGMKDYGIVKEGIYDDKKLNSRSNTNNKSYNVSISNAKPNLTSSTSISNTMLVSTSSSTNQTKSSTKSSRSSKKTTSTLQSKVNIDNNNACMFNQPIGAMKTGPNNDMLANFTTNFNNSLFCRPTVAMNSDNNKYQTNYTSSTATSSSLNNNAINNVNNSNQRTCSNLGMDYMSSQILGPTGPHHHPHFGFNHLFPEMDIPNSYLKFNNPGMADVETMPLHHHNHKNLHQPTNGSQTMFSDINPFFHPTQYAFDGSSTYFNQSNCSTGPFSMGTFNLRMPRMHHQQNNNSF